MDTKQCEKAMMRNGWRVNWENYQAEQITYIQFKESIYNTALFVRKSMGITGLFSKEIFDNGWQFLSLASEDYETAKSHMINLIFGWW